MKKFIARTLHRILVRFIASRRRPDIVIGQPDKPYLFRWWLFGTSKNRDQYGRLRPRRPLGFSVYLHMFMHPDDDRAHHDHPWNWWSHLLRGPYFEHRNEPRPSDEASFPLYGASEVSAAYDSASTTARVMRRYETGSFRGGKAEDAHRIDLPRDENPFYATHGDADIFSWMTKAERRAVLMNQYIPAWTIFITARYKREWGFHCPKGWVPWRQFTDATTGGNQIGAGCGEN